MGKIILLDEATINKIAAGEVIEKPASIIKELVENSIDAGATSVSIDVKDGGKSFISVSDNGCGISGEDLEYVFLRHATSKIKDSEDLLSIATLGFRGEAMASIAAVSEVEIQTKAEESSSGNYMLVRGGKIIETRPIGYPTGTGIIVRNLFYNTPARMKFLKSDTSEQGYIVDMVEKLALANTGVSMKLTVNSKTVLQTPGNGDLLSVIQCVYGKNIAKAMLLLDYESEAVSIEGYIGKPEIAKGNSTYMIFSVNDRIIKNKMLAEAARQAYKTLLMNNKYPFAILDINIDSSKIDVNVHPTKQDIKFSDDRAIFNTLYLAIKNCLNSSQLFYTAEAGEEWKTDNAAKLLKEQDKHYTAFDNEGNNAPAVPIDLAAGLFSEKPIASDTLTGSTPNKHWQDEAITKKTASVDKSANIDNDQSLASLNIIGQLFATYILCQKDNKFYLIDQHAAHERIMYEYLLEKYNTGDITVQQLLLPMVIELSPSEAELLNNNISIFYRLGFELEQFGENTIAVRSIPIIMGEPCTGEFFSDILNSINGSENGRIDVQKEKIIIRMACKNAIKAGQLLNMDEIKELLYKLSAAKTPFTCPHGRPTVITMERYELEKKFKRII